MATAAAIPHFSHTGTLTTSFGVPGPVAQIGMTKPGSPSEIISCPTLALTAGPAGTLPSGQGKLNVLGFETPLATPCVTPSGYSYWITSAPVLALPLQYDGTDFYFNIPARTITITGGPNHVNRTFYQPASTMKWVNPTSPVINWSRIQLRVYGAGPSADGYSLQITADWKIMQGANIITALP